jgi:hypothetical protein
MLNKRISPAWAVLCLIIATGCADNTNFTSKVTSEKTGTIGADKKVESGDALPGDPSASNPENSPKSPDADPNSIVSDQEGFQLSREFQTTYVDTASIKFQPKEGIIEQEFLLTSKYEQTEKSFAQISRPNVTKNFRQGNPGEVRTEKLFQADQGILDLLIVIDDSGSMAEEQMNLSTKLAPLLEYIKDSDWRIGVVTTDPARGCSRAVIQKGDSGVGASFSNAINAGLAGSGNEQGIRQAVAGLSCATAPFVRANSTVAVLIVSDEDNCSDGKGCAAPYNSPAYLTNFLTNDMKRKLGTDARVYGLYWDPTKTCPGAAIKANQYAKAVSDSSGTAGSICDADYSNTLLKISENVAAILKADFKLKSTPDNNSLTLAINGVAKTTGFEIIGDVLRFTELPPEAATIDVRYTVGAVPYQNRYPLGEKPGPGTLKVRFDGQMVSESGYEVEEKTNDLVFKTMPPTSADIKVDFLRDLPLQKTFDLAAVIKTGSLKIKINDQESTGFTYADGKVTMSTAPADAAIVIATFEKLVGPNLEYDLPLVGTDVKDIQARRKDDNAPVSAFYRDGKIVVDSTSHAEGKVVILSYLNSDSYKMDISLPHLPILETIKVAGDQLDCVLGDGFDVIGDLLKIDCMLDTTQELDVTFKYKRDPIKAFVIQELTTISDFNIEVFVNGQSTTDYIVNRPLILLNGDVPVDSYVKIVVSSKN